MSRRRCLTGEGWGAGGHRRAIAGERHRRAAGDRIKGLVGDGGRYRRWVTA